MSELDDQVFESNDAPGAPEPVEAYDPNATVAMSSEEIAAMNAAPEQLPFYGAEDTPETQEAPVYDGLDGPMKSRQPISLDDIHAARDDGNPSAEDAYESVSLEKQEEGNAFANFTKMAAEGAGVAGETIIKGYEAMREVHRASKEHSGAVSQMQEIEKELEESLAEYNRRMDTENNYDSIMAEQTVAFEAARTQRDSIQANIDALNAERNNLAARLEQMKTDHDNEIRPFKNLMDSSRSRAEDASRALADARRGLKNAENLVADSTTQRDARTAAAAKAVDNARARLAELQTTLEQLSADPENNAPAIENVNAAIAAEQGHYATAQQELNTVNIEMQRSMESAQAPLFTQKQSLEAAESANESARAEAQARKEDFDRMAADFETAEETLDNAVVEREMKIRNITKDLDAAQKLMDAAQDIIDDVTNVHSTPEITANLAQLIAEDRDALEVQRIHVENLAQMEKSLRESTKTHRLVFIGVIVAAVLLVILILWLVFFNK
ncbi:MAG: hypothetical protein IJH87_03675 [Atopobiaceae bacterium]|nr:hypothetical protein [Atopobiaceae bacterium]